MSGLEIALCFLAAPFVATTVALGAALATDRLLQERQTLWRALVDRERVASEPPPLEGGSYRSPPRAVS